ncbi:hypothetical protein IC582_012955 [Cucumis melo]|uniref:Uncharacterized protein n=3 Tax=Cucumis melo TaxID=3656 RepID=A0A9I9CPY1_CUCME
MGGRSKSLKCFSFCGILKSCCFPMGGRDYGNDYGGYFEDQSGEMRRRMWPSDEDRGSRWVAEPGIDRKASAFIARFYEARVSDPERQTLSL